MKGLLKYTCLVLCILATACGILVEKDRQVIAEIDKDPVRLQDLLRRIRGLSFEERARTNDNDPVKRIEARRAILKSIIEERLLAKEAEARGLAVSDEEVMAALDSELAEDVHSDDEALNDTMEGAGAGHEHSHGGEGAHTSKEIDAMRQTLMMEKLLQVALSDEAVHKYYNDNAEEFALPSPEVTAELIIARVEDSAVVDAVRQKAIAEKISLVDAYASLKDVAPVLFAGVNESMPLNNLMLPAMRRAIENLKEGEISEPIHLTPRKDHRYAVARPIKIEIYRPFEDVRGQAKVLLFRKFIGDLEKKYNVIYYDDKLDYTIS